MFTESMERRIVEVTFWRDGQRMADWLDSILKPGGGQANYGEGIISFRNGQGYGGGFHYGGDPITTAVMLASAIVGPFFWTKAFPGLLGKVDAEWKVQSRKKK